MKKAYFLFLLLLIPLIVFTLFAIICGISFSQEDWLTLSLSTASSAATIFLGVMVYIQAERHKETADKLAKDNKRILEENQSQTRLYQEEEKEYRKQDLIIRTAPNIILKKLDPIITSVDNVCITENSSACLRYYMTYNESIKEYSDKEFTARFTNGVYLTFVFNCSETASLKDVCFTSININTQPNKEKTIFEKDYVFINNKARGESGELSLIAKDTYSVGKFLMFPSPSISNSQEKEKFISDICKDKDTIFISLNYIAVNIHGIYTSGTLKFFVHVVEKTDRIVFSQPTNILNYTYPAKMIDKATKIKSYVDLLEKNRLEEMEEESN